MKQGNIGRIVFVQLSMLLTALMILFSGTYFYVIKTQESKVYDSAIVNSAGLQRMLLQRYSREISTAITSRNDNDLQSLQRDIQAARRSEVSIEKNFKSYLEGGAIVISADGGRQVIIEPLHFKSVRAAISNSINEWKKLKDLGIQALQEQSSQEKKEKILSEISQQANLSVHAQDNAVGIVQEEITNDTKMVIFVEEMALACSILFFLATLAYAYFRISLPVHKLYNELKDYQDNLETKIAEQTKNLKLAILEIEEASQSALRAKLQAEKANHSKSEFLANMSHELRTPLNSIMGFSRMFAEDTDMNEENRHMASTVHKAAAALLDIVNDILDLSKIEAGNMVLESIGFDFKEVIATIMDTMAPIASAKGVSLKCHYQQENIPFILGDPLRVSRIITNLVGNAIKYTSKGEVTIDVKCINQEKTEEDLGGNSEEFVEIICAVEDKGIGIAKEKLDTIFEKFTQADETISRKYGGTGLGLTITRDLVEMMGGKIGVESEVGKGSIFWFKIPFEKTASLAGGATKQTTYCEEPMKEEANKIKANQAKILIAEDHELNQAFIKKLLKRQGFMNFDLVENGILAVEAYARGRYDLILMDCHMPNKNGYQATGEIRELEKKTGGRIPIIALTADAMLGTREKCLEAGMTGYISKPINAKHFQEMMKRWFIFSNDIEKIDIQTEKSVDDEIVFDMTILEQYADSEDEMKDLCIMFFETAKECLSLLEEQCINTDNFIWSEIAHKIKGSSGMIGAEKLRKLAGIAQDMEDVNERHKRDMCLLLKTAYQETEQILKERVFGINVNIKKQRSS